MDQIVTPQNSRFLSIMFKKILFKICLQANHSNYVSTEADRMPSIIQGVPGGMDKTSGECSLC